VTGDAGPDTIFLGPGDDRFDDDNQTDWGQDQVFGGPGKDTIYANGGDDTLSGGPDADTFIFGWVLNHDVITDFEPGLDRIELQSRHWTAPVTQFQLDHIADTSSGDLVLTFVSGMSLTLQGITSTAGLVDDISLF